MRVLIKDDYNACSEWTAEYIATRIREHNATNSKPFVLGLPTGLSPMGTYKSLIKKYDAGEVSFKNVVTFNMDEYVGLPPDHPQSYRYFMNKYFFNHIDINIENTHIPNGMAKDCHAECQAYEKRIQLFGKIHLFLGGVGVDGHIAFNEPFSSFKSRTREKKLTTDTILANAHFFDNDIERIPKTALTVGIGTILDAEEVIIIATGYKKARAVRHAIEEPIQQKWPISALQNHPAAIIVCDTMACNELHVGTIRYFTEVEKARTDFRKIYD